MEKVWEQELYNEIDYKRKESLFHCFEGDTAFVGLSFMDEMEANHFHEKVAERIRKRRERAQAAEAADLAGNDAPDVKVSKPRELTSSEASNQTSKKHRDPKKKIRRDRSVSWRPWKKKDKKPGRPKLNASMIGAPVEESFVHIHSHSGPKKDVSGDGKQTVELDPRIQKLFALAKFDDYLDNPETIRQFQKWADETNIYDEIEEIEKFVPKKPAKAVPSEIPTSAGVPPPPPPVAPPPPPAPSDKSLIPINRNPSILDGIKDGRSPLKPVDQRHIEDDSTEQAMGDLLNRVFEKFARDMRPESSDEDRSDDMTDYDSDDW